jgi:hypothetical protein
VEAHHGDDVGSRCSGRSHPTNKEQLADHGVVVGT